MRLGGPVFEKTRDAEGWAAAVKRLGYSAAYCPVGEKADDATVRAYADAAAAADIVIAEVGAFGNNPISPDDATRKAGLEKCKARLALADRIGARCCVNCSGSRAKGWASPHPENLTDDIFALVVDSVREIVDDVKPTRSFYTLETMPYLYPDSVDCYVRLIRAIDRERFAVHLDPVNLVSSPQRYFAGAALLRECFKKLGRWTKSCHAKDVRLRGGFPVNIAEVRPGEGELDYHVFLTEAEKCDPDLPVMLEHLKGAGEYAKAADYVRSCAKEARVRIK
jgi:sugar phosphate isomerase/epimerase